MQDAVRLVVWQHAGNLVKQLDLEVDDRLLPKPYLGTPVSDAVAAFLALADGPALESAISLSIRDEAGIPLFRSDRVRTRPLAELREGLDDPDACDRLLTRVLRHAPDTLPGWTDRLTAALAKMQRTVAQTPAAPLASIASLTGAVERIADDKIVGWALDPQRPFLTLGIDVYRDGQMIATIDADRYRPDLKTDRAVSAHHGFGLDLTTASPGDHGRCLYGFCYSGSAVHLTGSPCRVVAGELVSDTAPDRSRCPTPDRVEALACTAIGATSLKGAIDFVDGRRVTGWAFDRHNLSKVLRLQFEVNGVPAGTATADVIRDDLEFLGAQTYHGFNVLLRNDTLASPWRELHRLNVRDLDSGALLVDGHPIRYRPDQDERESAAIVRRIQRLEQTLLELKEQLPNLRRRTAHSLDDYDLWYQRVHQPTLQYQARGGGQSQPDTLLPHIGVVVPLTAKCTLAEFQRVLASLEGEALSGHQYLIVNRSQNDQAYELLAHSYQGKLGRLLWIDAREYTTPAFLQEVLRYSGNQHLLLLRSGESLGPDALTWFARAFAQTPARILYADSDRIDESGAHREPEFRPDFNPDLLLSTPYIGSVCLDRDLLESLAAEMTDEPEGVWQYDLLLRAAERIEPHVWLHIARVLTHRVRPDTDALGDEQALARALSVLRAHIERSRIQGEAAIDEALYLANPQIPRLPRTFAARIRWPVPEPAPKVSIVVPTRDGQELVRTCIESILERTKYPDYEILLVDHESTDPAALQYFDSLDRQLQVRVLHYTGAFNWSAINNLAASRASGEVLCFLNNDTEVLVPDWLEELVGHACRPGIGAVGAKLLYRDGTLQHGGIILGVHGIAEHPFTGLPADKSGYMMRAGLVQNLSAVTGACLVCRRAVFDSVGGFDVVNLGVAFNDVDFCLRLGEAGYRNVWTPYARLYHEGSKTRGRDGSADKRSRLDKEMDYMRKRWPRQLRRDPYYNPAFERHDHPYSTLTCAACAAFPED